MADFAPQAEQNSEQEHAADIERNSRYGLQLFAVYLFIYLGYLLLSTFGAQMMQDVKVAGINLSVMYGFGLILSALVLALIYGFLCRNSQSTMTSSATTSETNEESAQ